MFSAINYIYYSKVLRDVQDVFSRNEVLVDNRCRANYNFTVEHKTIR